MAMNLINKRSGIQVPVITPPASNLLFSSNFANTVLGAFTDGGRAFSQELTMRQVSRGR